MKSNFSYKKVFFVFCFIIIILLFAGFCFWIIKEVSESKNDSIVKSSDISEFEIRNVNGKKVVENKIEGLLVEVPRNWIISPFKFENNENEISFFSPESAFNEKGDFIAEKSYLDKKACVIGMAIKKCEKRSPDIPTEAETSFALIKSIKEGFENDFSQNLSVISIGNKDSLKMITIKDNKITSIRTETPIGQTIYSFASGYIVNQDCVKYFDDFLKTVLINK